MRESLNQPLILIFEDLHWIDGETQGFLDVLSESVASARMLLLTNYRPEYRHEWGQKTYYTQLRLAPFGKDEAEEFLTVLLGEAVGTTGRSPLRTWLKVIRYFGSRFVASIKLYPLYVGTHNTEKLSLRYLWLTHRKRLQMAHTTTVQGCRYALE